VQLRVKLIREVSNADRPADVEEVYLDKEDADCILALHDALDKTLRKRFLKLSMTEMAELAWELQSVVVAHNLEQSANGSFDPLIAATSPPPEIETKQAHLETELDSRPVSPARCPQCGTVRANGSCQCAKCDVAESNPTDPEDNYPMESVPELFESEPQDQIVSNYRKVAAQPVENADNPSKTTLAQDAITPMDIAMKTVADRAASGPSSNFNKSGGKYNANGGSSGGAKMIVLFATIAVLAVVAGATMVLHLQESGEPKKYQAEGMPVNTANGADTGALSNSNNVVAPSNGALRQTLKPDRHDNEKTETVPAVQVPSEANGAQPLPVTNVGTASIAEDKSEVSETINKLIDSVQASVSDPSITEAVSQVQLHTKPPTGDVGQSTSLNKLGLKALQAKNYIEAVSLFKAASTANPADARWQSNLGFAEMHAGDLQSAQAHLFNSIALDPARPVAWGDLAEVFARSGNKDKAVSCFVIGYKISNGDTLGYLKSLSADENPAVQETSTIALNKLDSWGLLSAPVNEPERAN
jgi:hypothetical protein